MPRIPRLFRATLLLAVLAVCVGCKARAPTAEGPALDRLLRLMHERLTLMHDVARWKWDARKPIADPQRERDLLEKVVQQGQSKGLDPAFVRAFFAAQIEASKRIQQADFDHWKAINQGPFAGSADLSSLRERIDGLNHQLIDALAAAGPSLSAPDARKELARRAEEILNGDEIDAVRETVVAPLRQGPAE